MTAFLIVLAFLAAAAVAAVRAYIRNPEPHRLDVELGHKYGCGRPGCRVNHRGQR